MPMISTKLHGAGDYATGVGLLAAPKLLRINDGLASAVLRGTGIAILGLSAMTDYELGIRRRVPMRAHLTADAATGALMTAVSLRLRRRSRGVGSWLPHGLLGVGEIGAALMTARQPGDRPRAAAPTPSPATPTQPAPTQPASTQPAATQPAATQPPPTQPPPTRPAPASTASYADDDILVAREEAAAAAAAGRIGGPGQPSGDDPAMDPVYQAGGGEQEGWEQSEAALIENASHGEGHADPEADAFTPEVESDRSTAAFAEADSLASTELIEDLPEVGGKGEDTSGTPPRTP